MIKKVNLEGKTEKQLCLKLSEYVIIKFDTEKKELQKLFYLESKKLKETKPPEIVLTKTQDEILQIKKED